MRVTRYRGPWWRWAASGSAGPTLRASLVIVAGACSTPSAVDVVAEPPRGPDLRIDSAWVDRQVGSAPLILVAPHGGDLAPSELPDRSCPGCVYVNDANTQELARALADSFAARTGGRRPWLVINRLHRTKFDGNRDLIEATGGLTALAPHWTRFHASIDSAKAWIARSPTRGLVVDLHGHGHPIQRLELGYLLSDSQLRLTDSALKAGNLMSTSSVAGLASATALARGPDSAVALLRGPESLGGLLSAAGYPAVPSPADPAPNVADPYFDGGFNTARYGSRLGGVTDAIQIEHHMTGVRDTHLNRARYAGALAAALVRWLDQRYGWR